MKTWLPFSIAISVIISMSSCQQDVDPPGNETNDSIYIKQLIAFDTSKAPGQDTLLKYNYEYDGNKRLTRRTTVVYDPGIFSTIQCNVFYTGADILPSRIVSESTIAGNVNTQTTYFTYQNGVVYIDSTKDSSVPTAASVNVYQPLSATRTRIIRKYYNNVGALRLDTSFIFTQWINGNLVKEIDSTYNNIPTHTLHIGTSEITYDGQTNPFKRIFLPLLTPVYNREGLEYVDQFSIFSHPGTNNITRLDSDGTGVLNLTYKYNGLGLPVAAYIPELGGTIKIVYTYTSL